MNIDWKAIKDSKITKVALIIALPTVLVGMYYGYQYLKDSDLFKSKLKMKPDGSVDFTGMDYYRIQVPFTSHSLSDIYYAIVKVVYSPIGNKKVKDGGMFTALEIAIFPKDLEKLKTALLSLGADVKLDKFNIEESIIEKKINECVNDVAVIESLENFYDAIKCVKNSSIFGYDLSLLKNISNLETLISVDEMNQIIQYSRIKKPNDAQMESFLNIMHKIYP